MPVTLPVIAAAAVLNIAVKFDGFGAEPTFEAIPPVTDMEVWSQGAIDLSKYDKNLKIVFNIVNTTRKTIRFDGPPLHPAVRALRIGNSSNDKKTPYVAGGTQFTDAELSSDKMTLSVCYSNYKLIYPASMYALNFYGATDMDPEIRNGSIKPPYIDTTKKKSRFTSSLTNCDEESPISSQK
jgi:hypothetical protein